MLLFRFKVNNDSTVHQSTRTREPTQRLQQSVDMGLMESFRASAKEDDEYYDMLHEDDYAIQDSMRDPITFIGKRYSNLLYYHQAMSAPDKLKFQEAMLKEFNDYTERQY